MLKGWSGQYAQVVPVKEPIFVEVEGSPTVSTGNKYQFELKIEGGLFGKTPPSQNHSITFSFLLTDPQIFTFKDSPADQDPFELPTNSGWSIDADVYALSLIERFKMVPVFFENYHISLKNGSDGDTAVIVFDAKNEGFNENLLQLSQTGTNAFSRTQTFGSSTQLKDNYSVIVELQDLDRTTIARLEESYYDANNRFKLEIGQILDSFIPGNRGFYFNGITSAKFRVIVGEKFGQNPTIKFYKEFGVYNAYKLGWKHVYVNPLNGDSLDPMSNQVYASDLNNTRYYPITMPSPIQVAVGLPFYFGVLVGLTNSGDPVTSVVIQDDTSTITSKNLAPDDNRGLRTIQIDPGVITQSNKEFYLRMVDDNQNAVPQQSIVLHSIASEDVRAQIIFLNKYEVAETFYCTGNISSSSNLKKSTFISSGLFGDRDYYNSEEIEDVIKSNIGKSFKCSSGFLYTYQHLNALADLLESKAIWISLPEFAWTPQPIIIDGIKDDSDLKAGVFSLEFEFHFAILD